MPARRVAACFPSRSSEDHIDRWPCDRAAGAWLWFRGRARHECVGKAEQFAHRRYTSVDRRRCGASHRSLRSCIRGTVSLAFDPGVNGRQDDHYNWKAQAQHYLSVHRDRTRRQRRSGRKRHGHVYHWRPSAGVVDEHVYTYGAHDGAAGYSATHYCYGGWGYRITKFPWLRGPRPSRIRCAADRMVLQQCVERSFGYSCRRMQLAQSNKSRMATSYSPMRAQDLPRMQPTRSTARLRRTGA